ncbi:MAG TPA: alpha/beta hydrolase-fold protein [Saprospiraceae bacterium]|nr:alpha/beta hydrolase-fold protein [Saprospiraceae bacterium]
MQKLIRAAALLAFFALSTAASLLAQLTIQVGSIPANTPAADKIYIVGTFNNWNPADATKTLTKSPNGQYTITFTPPTGLMKFKFTRGSWSAVEGNATGGYLPDRELMYNGQPMTVNLSILSWEDLGGSGGGGTAAPNVSILSSQFNMPQLNRKRRIWLYLPPDYGSSTKKYPVLYMHDGQNLFDSKTAAFGTEWKVDESLNTLHQQGDYGCIVVAIDNGGADRISEYSPWVNPQYGGGQGDEYMDFIIKTLKPHIDSNYRTLPGRLTTGIMGSSLGGLISFYGSVEYQEVFGKAGGFSPSFWFARQAEKDLVLANGHQAPIRIYLMAGTDEEGDGNASNYVVEDMQNIYNTLLSKGFTTGEMNFQTRSDGQHAEWFWAREFPDAYKWLFAGVVPTAEPAVVQDLKISPNPATGNTVRLPGLENGQRYRYQIVGMEGKIWRDSTDLIGGERVRISDLPRGMYIVRVQKIGDSVWHAGKLSVAK